MLDVLEYLVALFLNRESAVAYADVTDMPLGTMVGLSFGYYLVLGLAGLWLIRRPRVKRTMEHALASRYGRGLVRIVDPVPRVPALFVVILVPAGFWISLVLMDRWRLDYRLRIGVIAVANPLSVVGYNTALSGLSLAPMLVALAVLIVLPHLPDVVHRLRAATSWTLRHYRRAYARTLP